jgi:serine/threonine-protein kinase HipA
MLYLSGVTRNFNPVTAHRSKHKLVKICRGVFCDPEDAVDAVTMAAFMRKNAVRIANYVLPGSALAMASAYAKGPVDVPDAPAGYPMSRLYLAGKYIRTWELPNLEIVQTYTLKNTNVEMFALKFIDGREDEFGEMKLRCMCDEVTFLQNFERRRGHLDRFLPRESLQDLRRILEARHGENLVPELARIIEVTGEFGEEMSRACSMLATPMETAPKFNAVNTYELGWNNRHIGNLSFTGNSWRTDLVDGWVLPVSMSPANDPDQIPIFLKNLMPEGFLQQAVHMVQIQTGNKRTVVDASERFLSNLTLSREAGKTASFPLDRLHGKLAEFTRDGTFTGVIEAVPQIAKSLAELKQLAAKITMPRIAGFQEKLPVFIDAHGRMQPADNKPFTHILKFPGYNGDQCGSKGAVEWLGLELLRAGGIATTNCSMVRLKDNTIGLISERCDIANAANDMRRMLIEDFCSLMGKEPAEKYNGTSEDVGRRLRELSTNFAEDSVEFYKQVCANLMVENNDMHLKNVSVLLLAHPMMHQFRSVRLAPAYDVMCTWFYSDPDRPETELERMSLTVNGKDNSRDRGTDQTIHLGDLQALAQTLDIPPCDAEDIARSVAEGMLARAREIHACPPTILNDHPEVADHVMRCCQRLANRIGQLFPDVDSSLTIQEPASKQRTCP